MTLATGSKLGPYEIVAPIGAGGMGEVYRAQDTRLGRTVAIKVLNKEHMQRFEREARAIAALNHPHICTLHDIGPDYLVMEYVEGAAIKGPMAVEEAVRLAIQIAGALEEAHRSGILHRDLKPGNIMVTSNGVAKLLDFGLAKLATGTDSDTASTMDGTVMGTPAYMSPEQAQGNAVDARSDIFSFGAVLYEIISGSRAFGGTSTVQVLSAVLRDEPKPLQTMPQLERIVMRSLAKQPGQRFQTMAEVKTALAQVSAKPAEPQPSIAVLPFADMSPGKDNEWFSDGLAEEMINALAQIPELKVIARTSAFAFKGKQEDITKIAEALRVSTILEGSVRKAGNRIRITAQLINAGDGSHIWSERYDREMTDIFAIQDEISRAIAEKMRVQISGDRPIVKRYTENLEAYTLYLKGHYHLGRMAPDSLAKGKECFEQALAADPNYALGWAGLADFYHRLGALGFMPSRGLNAQARQAVLKALEIDGALAEAHGIMAVLHADGFNWNAAEREFHRALELDPNSTAVMAYYGIHYLLPMRRFYEAFSIARKLLELDPLSAPRQYALGLRYAAKGQYDLAINQYRNALELDPHFGLAHLMLAIALIMAGRCDEGVQASEAGVQLTGRVHVPLALLSFAYARANRIREAREVLEELRKLSEKSYVPSYAFAITYLGLEEIDTAFDWFEKAMDETPGMIFLNLEPPFFSDTLRSHPRYHALLRKMNLEP